MMFRKSDEINVNFNNNAIRDNDTKAIDNLIQMVDASLAESTSVLEEIELQLNSQKYMESYNGQNPTLVSPNKTISDHVHDWNEHDKVFLDQSDFDPLPLSTNLPCDCVLDFAESSFLSDCFLSTDANNEHQPKDQSLLAQTSCSTKPTAACNRNAFPQTLYQILDDAIEHSFNMNIIGWDDNGTSFRVHDRKRFVSDIMPMYFEQTKYASFIRQLSLYGYQRIKNKDKYNGSYYHERFLQGHRDLVNTIRRNTVKENTTCFSYPTMEFSFDTIGQSCQEPMETSNAVDKTTDLDNKNLDSTRQS
jgi:HSF-type DNA-binding